MLNLSPLFHSSDEDATTLLDDLDLTDIQRATIAQAKLVVRTTLRDGLPRVLREAGTTTDVPTPRFFTQGSWAYKTLNAPAHETQQADVDDGAYLPLSFVSETARPSTASSVFFRAAEAALAPVVRARGWKLISDKDTCVRVEISPWAHIDIPLYAIPDAEFETLAKAAALRGYALNEAARRAEQDSWDRLPKNCVLLAHRERDWLSSDPRPVKEWFIQQVADRGEQLRRIVRYLKGFRDWQWRGAGAPSSILLMAAAAPLFEKRDRRDDLALLDVVSQLPATLRRGVNSPVDANENLTKRLGADNVEAAARTFEALDAQMKAAREATPHEACARLRQMFGPRFPDAPHRVQVVSVAATVAAAPARATPSVLVGRTRAG
jgi:hypothetical protein